MVKFYLFLISFFVLLGGSVMATDFVFKSDLAYGLRNSNDVSRLQEFLTGRGLYTGPITGNFLSLTREAVIKFQTANGIEPASGYFGPKTRAVANSATLLTEIKTEGQIQKLISDLMAQVKIIQDQLTAAQIKEEAKKVAESVPLTPVILEPLVSTMKISVLYPSLTLSRYTNVVVNEIRFGVENQSENIAISRIKFTNTGTLGDANFASLALIESGSGRELAKIDTLKDNNLAIVGDVRGGVVEFKMKIDPTKPDNGLMVADKAYSVIANIVTPNTVLLPTIRLDIVDVKDLDVIDLALQNRQVIITKNNNFPIEGPRITVPRL